MSKDFKGECREKCRDIFRNTIKEPKEWFADNILEIEEHGDIVRVYTGFGGPTEWWSFNTATRSGRYFYHYGEALCHRDFGRNVYEKLMAFVR